MEAMISPAMNDKLNAQVTNEFGASHMYLQMACACEERTYKAMSAFFYRQSQEEREHAMKIAKYILEVGGQVTLGAIPQPSGDFATPLAIFQAALAAEQTVTRQIHDLVALAEQEKDYASRSFLQWFVDEQVEEVSTMSELVDIAERAKEVFHIEMHVRQMLASE